MSPREAEVCLVAGGKQVHGSPDGLFDCADGLAGVCAVAQHGGCEDVGAHAVEVTRALQVPGEHVDRAGDAFRGEFARINVGRKPRHHLVVDDASEVLAGDGLLLLMPSFTSKMTRRTEFDPRSITP